MFFFEIKRVSRTAERIVQLIVFKTKLVTPLIPIVIGTSRGQYLLSYFTGITISKISPIIKIRVPKTISRTSTISRTNTKILTISQKLKFQRFIQLSKSVFRKSVFRKSITIRVLYKCNAL